MGKKVKKTVEYKIFDEWLVRIWDTQAKIMYYQSFLPYNDGIGFKDKSGTCGLIITLNLITFMLENNDRFVFMRSTGLHDIKGTLIYEGDLISSRYNSKMTDSIRWSATDASFVVEHSSLPRDYSRFDQQWIRDCEISVVGNIFEHPNKRK